MMKLLMRSFLDVRALSESLLHPEKVCIFSRGSSLPFFFFRALPQKMHDPLSNPWSSDLERTPLCLVMVLAILAA